MAKFNIVLVAPEIPGNTGSIGRTCVALDLRLILIRPYGFRIDQKAVRRAGLDYWQYVNLTEYSSWEEFEKHEAPPEDQLFFFSKKNSSTYYQAEFKPDCYLIFGSETKGLPHHISEKYANRFYHLPMFSDKIRSLNLSNVATAVAYETLRQLSFN